MKYRRLGKTDLMVSEIGFGGWGIGGKDWGKTDNMVSMDALDAAYAAGINFYDTAPSYGLSETLMATAFRNCRDKVIICTKTVDCDITESLRHFDYIDVLLLHGVPLTLDLAMKLEKLIIKGDIRYAGTSAKEPANANRLAGIAEVNFSMMDTRALTCGLLGAGLGIIARTPLNFGFLTGLITADTKFPEGHHLNNWPREKLEHWAAEARKCLGDTPPGRESVRKALRWVLDHKVSTAIVGMMTPEHVADACS